MREATTVSYFRRRTEMDRITQMIEKITAFFGENVIEPIKQMSITDCIDVLLLTVILYMIIRFVSNRRAGKLATGCLLIIAVLVIAEMSNMHAMKYILSNFYQVGFIAIIIIFQDELRTALEKVGGFSSKLVSGIEKQTVSAGASEVKTFVDEVCDAVFEMSETSTGALIVVECNTKVGDCIETGTEIDAKVSSSLLQNIFVDKSPLHDGAVIIREMRIAAAGCRLPASKRKIGKTLGTRHNAAVGLSEVASDALVIVVSEETGVVSFCFNGEIRRNYTREKLTNELCGKLLKEKRRQRFLSDKHHGNQYNVQDDTADSDDIRD